MRTLMVAAAVLAAALFASAQSPAVPTPNLTAVVLDGVGRPVSQAAVTVADLRGHTVATAVSDEAGAFHLALDPGDYRILVEKPSFAAYSSLQSIPASGALHLGVALDLAPMQRNLVVAATGVPTPQSQLGQSVEVLDRDQLDARDALTADEALRDMTDIQVDRDGALGGLSSVSLRGSDPSLDKILLDGVPLQRVDFGAFDFSTLVPAGLDQIQIVRGADSVVYGTDAAAGVIDIASRSGEGVPAPELTSRSTYGSFATIDQDVALLGSWRPLDYSFTYDYLDTHNQLPNDKDRAQTWAGNVGFKLPRRTRLRLNLRHAASNTGDPNAFLFYGIADDSYQWQGETYASAVLQQQTTSNWTNRLTLSQASVNYFFDTISPSGTLDPNTGNYLGLPVTIAGANGYTVHGQAVLDFAGAFPQPFASDTLNRNLDYESTYQFAPNWKLVAGYRFEDDRGVSTPVDGWRENGGFAEIAGGAWNRLFASAGLSEDTNSQFGSSLNPQASLAFLPRLARGGWFNETRLHANAGTAQKDPNITEAQSSLFAALGPASAAALGVEPIHPVRARNYDFGVDQYFVNDRIRFSLTAFNNRYDDLIEFVPYTAFGLLGISPAVTALAEAQGGAYLNSQTEDTKGLEFELLARNYGGWHASVSYSLLDPRVLQSFSSDAQSPSFNPQFPNIPIGAFAPLVGARPFHVAPESGAIVVGYQRRRWSLNGNASISSRRDDSTFLTDPNYGSTLLLPNHDLDPAYTALNISGFYHFNARFTGEAVMENLLNQDFQETAGYPSLGRAARIGVRIALTRPPAQ